MVGWASRGSLLFWVYPAQVYPALPCLYTTPGTPPGLPCLYTTLGYPAWYYPAQSGLFTPFCAKVTILPSCPIPSLLLDSAALPDSVTFARFRSSRGLYRAQVVHPPTPARVLPCPYTTLLYTTLLHTPAATSGVRHPLLSPFWPPARSRPGSFYPANKPGPEVSGKRARRAQRRT